MRIGSVGWRPHVWLKGRAPKSCLLATIDDPTGKAFMRFCDSDNEWYEMRFLRDYCIRFLTDRAASKSIWFQQYIPVKKQQPSFRYRKAGNPNHFANSQQAKGREKRHKLTLHDRLVEAIRRLIINFSIKPTLLSKHLSTNTTAVLRLWMAVKTSIVI